MIQLEIPGKSISPHISRVGILRYHQDVRDLSVFKKNVWSQFGEDGIIEEVLNRISLSGEMLNRWACEFGSWDGLHLSNTANLIRNYGYRSVSIEGDPQRFEEIKVNFPSSDVVKICSYVGTSGETSLDAILKRTDIPSDFDFLSIDIDGNDFHVLSSLKLYRPKLICIEFNPSIPNAIHFVQVNSSKVNHGSSAKAISELGTALGYDTIAATDCNLFLLKKQYTKMVCPTLRSLEDLVPSGENPQYIFFGYDGTVLSNKNSVCLPWHGTFSMSRLQILPKNLRKYSGNYSQDEWEHLKNFMSEES